MAEVDRRILIPVDASENSLRAFRWYLENLWRLSDSVYLIHCTDPPVLNSLKHPMNIPINEWEEEVKAQMEGGKRIESLITSTCAEKKMKNLTVKIIHADKPEEAIVAFADNNDMSIIVIGNRRLGKYKRAFLGSVSDYIVRHARIPVTIVPPKK